MAFPGEKLCEKLVQQLSIGIGAISRPWIIKRDARANALAQAEATRIKRLSQEQLRQDLRDVRAGKKKIDADLHLIELKESSEQTAVSADEMRLQYMSKLQGSATPYIQILEMERLINLDQIGTMALEEAQSEKSEKVDESSIDPDWFSQWRNRAQDVSEEQMQRLWARILKEEAKSSRSFNVHTLDFLSRMSRSDAELIAKLGNFALDGKHVFGGADPILHAAGLGLEQLLYLSDLGLLSGVSGTENLNYFAVYQEVQPNIKATAVRCNDKAIIFYPKTIDQSGVKIPGYPISIVGRQLLQLASCTATPEYLLEIAAIMKSKCEKIEIADATLVEGSVFEVSNQKIV